MGDQNPPHVINHFSHVYSLMLSNCPKTHSPSSCAGCEEQLFGWIYTCDPCKYSLHLLCSQAPQSIQYIGDTNHSLWLQYPAYPQLYFYCNECGGQGRSFFCHCVPCCVDLHLLCAFKALPLYTQAHNHPLQLFFRPPNSNLPYCDICEGVISSKGHYRCNMCNFDAHVACALHRALTMSNIDGDPGRRVHGGSSNEAQRGLGLHHGFSRISPYIPLFSAVAQFLVMLLA